MLITIPRLIFFTVSFYPQFVHDVELWHQVGETNLPHIKIIQKLFESNFFKVLGEHVSAKSKKAQNHGTKFR